MKVVNVWIYIIAQDEDDNWDNSLTTNFSRFAVKINPSAWYWTIPTFTTILDV